MAKSCSKFLIIWGAVMLQTSWLKIDFYFYYGIEFECSHSPHTMALNSADKSAQQWFITNMDFFTMSCYYYCKVFSVYDQPCSSPAHPKLMSMICVENHLLWYLLYGTPWIPTLPCPSWYLTCCHNNSMLYNWHFHRLGLKVLMNEKFS